MGRENTKQHNNSKKSENNVHRIAVSVSKYLAVLDYSLLKKRVNKQIFTHFK